MKRRKENNPLVSVVMAVYNGEAYLREAILSVLNQTYTNFEFIIVNDASTDNTVKIIEEFQDKRIKLIHNATNLRLAASLNRGIQAAKGKYILRMDADDICFPTRIERQVSHMEKHPEIGIAFGDVLKFSNRRTLPEIDTNERKPEYIRATLLFFNTVYHNNVIMRREIFKEYEYTLQYTVAEDMELWLKVTDRYPIVKVRGGMALYRIHKEQSSQVYRKKQLEQEIQMKKPYLERLLGPVTEEECEIHSKVSYRKTQLPISKLQMWLTKLKQGNLKTHIYNQKVFEQVLIRVGIITAWYNHYPVKMAEYLVGEFGIGRTFISFFRIVKNIVEESIMFLFHSIKAKIVINTYAARCGEK